MAIGLASVSHGASMITENIFDGRFMFVQEMVRLGAEIRGPTASTPSSVAASGCRRRWCGRPTSGPVRA